MVPRSRNRSYEKRALCRGGASPTVTYRVALGRGSRDPERTELYGASRAPSGGSHLNLGAGLSVVLHVEMSNGKRSLFWRSAETERKGGKAEAWGYANHQ